MPNTRYLLALVSGLAFASLGSTDASAQDRSRDYRSRGQGRLTGTYELDRRQSDDPERAVRVATRSLPPGQRDRVYQNYIARLDSPDTLAIDVNRRSVSIMSSNAPRVTFDADGQRRIEAGPRGRSVTTLADVRGSQLFIETSGNRGADFSATFEPVPGGLRVTRRLDSDYQQNSVTVRSVYRRVSDARWNIYSQRPDRDRYGNDRVGNDRIGNDRGGYDAGRGVPARSVFVPDGTRLTARLDAPLSTRTSRQGEHFTLTVVGGPYDNAVIDGVVARSEGQRSRADIAFDFEGIRFRDGRSSQFEGVIESVNMPDGSSVRVDQSGSVRDRGGSTGKTVEHGAIGAAIGAIIGAVAGGQKGAVVGAIIGGGAGMIVLDGRNELNLPVGTMLSISAYAPRVGQQ